MSVTSPAESPRNSEKLRCQETRQRRRLEEIAHREGKSISAITRQVIDAGLERIENEAELWKKRANLLSSLRRRREKQIRVYTGDLINEARQEREGEGDQVWQNPS